MLVRLAPLALCGCISITTSGPSLAKLTHRQWHALDTPRVHLETDLPVEDATKLVQVIDTELQQTMYLYTLLGGVLSSGAGLVRVVLFSDCDDHHWFGGGWGAPAVTDVSTDLDEIPTVSMCKGQYSTPLLRHELTHTLNWQVFGSLPTWLNEGLAEYLQGARRSGDVIEIGPPPAGAYDDDDRSFDAARRTPWRRSSGAYHASWKAVYAMMNRSKATRDHALLFLGDLASGISETAAWDRRMRDVEPEVRDAYSSWSPSRQVSWKIWASPEEPVTATIRSMTPVEVAGRLVDLNAPHGSSDWLWVPATEWNNLRHLEHAGDTALYWRAIIAYRSRNPTAGDPRALFAAYVRRRPEDPRGHLGWLLVTLDAIAADAPPPADRQHRLDALADTVKKVVPIATTPTALESVGRYWVMQDKPEIALPFLRRALERNRACSRCYETLAHALYDERDFAGAVAAEERAITARGDAPPTPAMTWTLGTYRKALAASAAPAPAAP